MPLPLEAYHHLYYNYYWVWHGGPSAGAERNSDEIEKRDEVLPCASWPPYAWPGRGTEDN